MAVIIIPTKEQKIADTNVNAVDTDILACHFYGYLKMLVYELS